MGFGTVTFKIYNSPSKIANSLLLSGNVYSYAVKTLLHGFDFYRVFVLCVPAVQTTPRAKGKLRATTLDPYLHTLLPSSLPIAPLQMQISVGFGLMANCMSCFERSQRMATDLTRPALPSGT